MKLTMILILGICAIYGMHPTDSSESLINGKDKIVMFWNIENFFEPHSPNAHNTWTGKRFYSKCDGISKTIMLVADKFGRLPDVICLAEVENRSVLNKLLRSTLLRKLGYTIIHYDSPDHRGIDCAILCRNSTMQPISSAPKHLYDSTGTIMPTRDILLAQFDSLSVLVNHHPSKVGNGKSSGRSIAMKRMNSLADSLLHAGTHAVLSVGDFNDHIWNTQALSAFGNTAPGTIKYNGEWEKIDGYFLFGNIGVREYVFDSPLLLEKDKKFGGSKPRRTFIGPRYNGGISDHLPVIFIISQE